MPATIDKTASDAIASDGRVHGRRALARGTPRASESTVGLVAKSVAGTGADAVPVARLSVIQTAIWVREWTPSLFRIDST